MKKVNQKYNNEGAIGAPFRTVKDLRCTKTKVKIDLKNDEAIIGGY